VLDFLRRTSSGRSASIAAPFSRFGGTFVLVVVSATLAAGTIARNREYASGLSLARTTLARWPSGLAHHMVGSELAFLGRDHEAIPYMREAIRTYPSGRYNLGVALFNTGALDEAIEELQTFVRQEPRLLEVVSARSILGQAFMIKERWPEATEQFRLVLAMVPSNMQARRLLADALSRQQAFEEASLHYREYLAARPRDTVALGGLGVALASSGKLDEAISTFRQAVALEPQSPKAHFNLGTALLDHDEADAARAEAERAVALSPNDADAYDLLGRSLALQGKLGEAIAQFERSLRIDPNHAAARGDLTEVLRASRSRTGSLP
jgi:protein O-GlcNAc transferase